MAKCVDCGAETKNTVYEPNIGEQVPLCNYCKDAFYRKCKICGQYYSLKEDEELTDEQQEEQLEEASTKFMMAMMRLQMMQEAL